MSPEVSQAVIHDLDNCYVCGPKITLVEGKPPSNPTGMSTEIKNWGEVTGSTDGQSSVSNPTAITLNSPRLTVQKTTFSGIYHASAKIVSVEDTWQHPAILIFSLTIISPDPSALPDAQKVRRNFPRCRRSNKIRSPIENTLTACSSLLNPGTTPRSQNFQSAQEQFILFQLVPF